MCPRCKSIRAVAGSLSGKGDGASFMPGGLRLWKRLKGGPRTHHPVMGCLDCGLVWTAVSADELAQFLQKYGTEETHERLRAVETPTARTQPVSPAIRASDVLFGLLVLQPYLLDLPF